MKEFILEVLELLIALPVIAWMALGLAFFLNMLLGGCTQAQIVPSAYLENCYSQHCNKGDRACDCLAESRACQNKLNAQIDKIRAIND